jgi:conserved oligomeric Golgi complex subunit 4
VQRTRRDKSAVCCRQQQMKLLQVSKRVRRLDTAQNNLISTIDRIQRALDSGTCISAVQSALDAQDYEAAAANIGKYQQLQEQSPNGSVLPRGVPGAAYANQVVAQAREKLLVVVRDNVAAACAERDAKGMLRFLQLYKPLNVPQEGMSAALSFIRRCAAAALQSVSMFRPVWQTLPEFAQLIIEDAVVQ